jgi:hypothetical protein
MCEVLPLRLLPIIIAQCLVRRLALSVSSCLKQVVLNILQEESWLDVFFPHRPCSVPGRMLRNCLAVL